MSTQYDIGIFGGDLRQVFMARSFLSKGYQVAIYNTIDPVDNKNCYEAHSLRDLFDQCTLLIGPVPLSRDQISVFSNNASSDLTIAQIAYLLQDHHILSGGNLPETITMLCDERHISYYDFMKNEKITILNAIATAEGAIVEAISNSNCNLHGSNCLVLGYGRCAKILASKLKALDACVTVAARNKDVLAFAYAFGHHIVTLTNMKELLSSFQYVFNTIPSFVLDQECLDLVDKNVTIIDIASAPGGIDFDYAKQLSLNARLCLGLPGKIAPKASAEILVSEILTYVRERSD